MAARFIRLGFTPELDHANIANIDKLLTALQDVDFGPGPKNLLNR